MVIIWSLTLKRLGANYKPPIYSEAGELYWELINASFTESASLQMKNLLKFEMLAFNNYVFLIWLDTSDEARIKMKRAIHSEMPAHIRTAKARA